MKTSELTGAALDWAVAKAEGYTPIQVHRYQYSTNWAQSGPIIERERIRLWAMNWNFKWEADFPHCDDHRDDIRMSGPTPLIAAMRCYVASKLGGEVEIPKELT